MAILPSMTLEQPTVGASRGQWGGILNANLAKIDGHTHVAGQGEPVPVAGIEIDADLSFGSLYGPKDLHAITFASIVALSSNTYNKSLFVSDGTGGLSANELYWRNSTGNHVKLTSGTSLNVAAFVGGITGDYTSVGAAEAFDNADKDYTFKDGAGKWAGLRAGTLALSPKGGTSTFRVTLQPPAGLAASYAVTWPAAVPASTSLVQMSSAGVLTASDTLPATTEIHHGDRVLNISACSGVCLDANFTIGTHGQISSTAGNSPTFVFPINLHQGDQIKSITFARLGSGAGDFTATVSKVTSADSSSSIGTATVTTVAAAWTDTTINVTDTTVGAGEIFILSVVVAATGGSTLSVNNIRITYDHP